MADGNTFLWLKLFVLRLLMTTRGEQNDLDLKADLFGFELADPCAVNTAPSSIEL